MLSFKEQFHSTQQLVDKGLYKDKKWVEESIKSLSELKKLWPKEGTSYDIAEITGHPEWYVDQISYWCFIPEDTLKIELESHGSLKLNYLLQYLEIDEEEKIIEQLATARTNDATAEHVTDNLFIKFLEDSKNTKKTDSARNTNSATKRARCCYMGIFEFRLLMEAGDEFNKLIRKLAEDKKYTLRKRESELFIDEMEGYINFQYLEGAKPAKKVSLYKELVEIIKK